MRVCARFVDDPGSRTACGRGRKPMPLLGCSALTPRLIRGHRILVPTRGKACPVSNMMRDTLPPLLAELRAPVLKLRDDGFNAAGLLDGAELDAPSLVSIDW